MFTQCNHGYESSYTWLGQHVSAQRGSVHHRGPFRDWCGPGRGSIAHTYTHAGTHTQSDCRGLWPLTCGGLRCCTYTSFISYWPLLTCLHDANHCCLLFKASIPLNVTSFISLVLSHLRLDVHRQEVEGDQQLLWSRTLSIHRPGGGAARGRCCCVFTLWTWAQFCAAVT